MSQEAYISYQNMLTTVTTGVAKLGNICNDLEMAEQEKSLEQVRDRLQNHIFSVGIMGEFKRGKSTVINALLEQPIVPADILPCSATLNYVRWSPEKRAEIHFVDGTVKTVPVEDLSKYVTKITEESKEMAQTVDHAVVYYPCNFCQNGVQIVDTPGLNDDDRMTAISEKVIPTLDAIIMVLAVDSPFSASEAEFVRNKVMTSDLGRIIFVVNKIDHIDEEDVDRVLDAIRIKIENSVLEKTAAVYGKDSEEYQNTKAKLGDIRVLPISARNALRGKMKNDRRKFEESGYPEFEAMLSRLLTQERGMLELLHPANKIQSVAKEAVRTIDMRLNAMQLEADDFQDVQEEALKTIKANRERKKGEIKLLRAKGKTLYADLLPEVDAAYNQMLEDVRDYVQDVSIEATDIQSNEALQAFSERITPQINQKITDVLSIQTERMMHQVSEQLGKDVEYLEEFGKEFASDMQTIQTNISLRTKSTSGGKPNTGVAAAIGAATMFIGANVFDAFIPGVGGIIAGWREHGLKGAVVGGLAGSGIALGAVLAAGALGVVGLPAALIGGIAAAFGGKGIANLFFGKKKVEPSVSISEESVRINLLKAADTSIENLRSEKVLEKWLKDTCNNTYEKVAEDIDREWENTLGTMERTLSKIEADLVKNAEDKIRAEEEMQNQLADIQEIMNSLEPVYKKLNAGLVACEV